MANRRFRIGLVLEQEQAPGEWTGKIGRDLAIIEEDVNDPELTPERVLEDVATALDTKLKEIDIEVKAEVELEAKLAETQRELDSYKRDYQERGALYAASIADRERLQAEYDDCASQNAKIMKTAVERGLQIETLEAEIAREREKRATWIDFRERRPTEQQEVLIWFRLEKPDNTAVPQVAVYEADTELFAAEDYIDPQECAVIFWQPLSGGPAPEWIAAAMEKI